MKAEKSVDYTLYLATDRGGLTNIALYDAVEQAISGGVTLVQLREKNAAGRELLETALKMKAITDKHNIPLVINDRVDIALAVDAAGVHLGQKDLPCKTARTLLGKHKIIGVSASTVEEAILAQQDGADYIGSGALFQTNTKADVRSVTVDKLAEIVSAVDIPVVAIGGIHEGNIAMLKGTGIKGVAVVSAILQKHDYFEAAKQLKEILSTW